MTVLQKIIQFYEISFTHCDDPGNCEMCEIEREVVKKLKKYLSEEEQQIRDAWKAGQLEYTQNIGIRISKKIPLAPDIETYISKLKDKQ